VGERSEAEVIELLLEAGVAVAPILDVRDLADDAHLRHRGLSHFSVGQ